MLIRPAQPIATVNKPFTDRRAVFVTLDNESGIVDLLIPQRNERFGQLRCIYIDTSAQDSSGNGCTIQTDIGQSIVALAQTQGYYPVFVPFVSKLTISSNETANIVLLDFDVQPATWQTSLQSSSVPNPLHVIIDDQPIATNATVQNWPASQHVTVDGQPLSVNSTVQNWPTNFPVSQNSSWTVSVSNFPAIQPVSGTVAATQSGAWNIAATQSGTWNVGITGTATVTWTTAKPVSVSNFPATQAVTQSGSWAVSISNFPTTQPVSGTVSATQSGAWNVGINNWPTSQHVTIDGQPITVNSTVQNWPANLPVSQNSVFSIGQNKAGQVNINANGTFTALNGASLISQIIFTCCGFTNTSLGQMIIKDPAGNSISSFYIPILNNFTGILAVMDITITGAGTGLWSFVTTGCTITAGIFLVTAIHN